MSSPTDTTARQLVSVVMSFFQAERCIVEAIESVRAQTWPEWELVPVDDGSSDGSSAIAHDYATRFPNQIRYLQPPGGMNRGMTASRNLGTAAARGSGLAFLDADDVWMPQRPERHLALLERLPRPAVVIGSDLRRLASLFLAALCAANAFAAAPDSSGQTGLVSMPDARIATEGVLDFGLTYSGPESALYSTLAVFPWLEGSFEFQQIEGVPISPTDSSRYRDKAFHLKLIALPEKDWRPAIAFGATDIHGTKLYASQYIVASKTYGDIDLTLGWGTDRIDGVFGGVRWRPDWAKGLGLVVEHDAHDYTKDLFGGVPADPTREGGLAASLEYQGRWWGLAATSESGELGGRAWLRFDFGQPSWAPKPAEPAPLSKPPATPPPPAAAWRDQRPAVIALAKQLYAQDFDAVEVGLEGTTLRLLLTNQRISLIGRAVGRAARTALLYGPPDATALRITYTRDSLPIATYSFTDLALLRRYFVGRAGPAELAPTVAVTYATPADDAALRANALLLADDDAPELGDPEFALNVGQNARGQLLAFERYKRNTSSWQLKPIIVQGYFNDIDTAFAWDVFAAVLYKHQFGHGLELAAAARLTLYNDIDQVSGLNTSTLPHVRSDIALYKAEEPLKVDHLYLAKYAQLGERLYARFSAGLYEEMFAGAGGQILWLPAKGNWATDLSLEYARQRDYDGLGLLDYDTVTALAALHYRVPSMGLTFTGRGGRFLARDSGVRVEVNRRFRSGFVAGAWYTVTDGNDYTGPGTPGNPYNDKGVFLSVPLSVGLPYDSRSRASFSIAPWTRDVGAMIRFPGDLYYTVEDALLQNTTDVNPLSQLGR